MIIDDAIKLAHEHNVGVEIIERTGGMFVVGIKHIRGVWTNGSVIYEEPYEHIPCQTDKIADVLVELVNELET